MELQDIIDEIDRLLKEVYKEEELYQSINYNLNNLRELYRSNRNNFSTDNIDFLKKVSQINIAIQEFIDLKDEFANIYNMEYYDYLMDTLEDLKNRLQGTAIIKRVDKEMRALIEKFPAIERREITKSEAIININIIELEKKGHKCPKGHKMVIRKADNRYFWGCSHFPRCFYTKELNKKENDFLYS